MNSPTERRPGVPTWPWLAASLLVALFGLWATWGTSGWGAMSWMDVFDLKAFRRPGQIADFLAGLRVAVPPVLAVAEIVNHLVAGHTDWVNVHLYRLAFVGAYVLAIALTFPSVPRLVGCLLLSVVFLWSSVQIHVAGPNVYDPVYPLLLLGFFAALRFAPQGRTGAFAAGLCLTLAELTRPFVIVLMPMFVFGALWTMRPLDKGRVLAFVLPILALSGLWHAHQLLSFGQIVWSNHGGYNVQRAWPMVPLPPLVSEERADRTEIELDGSFNTEAHGENSRRVLRAVLAHISAHPLDSAVHAAERVAFVLAGEINLQGRIPDSPVIPVYATLVKYPALWMMLASLVILAAMVLKPRAAPWIVADRDNMLILSTVATLLIFALTEAGEEARFLIQVLPMLALLPAPTLSPDPDPVRYGPRTRRLAWAAAVVAVIGIELFAQGALRRQAAAAQGGALVPPRVAAPTDALRIGVLHVRGGWWRDRETAARRIAACFDGLHVIGLNGVRGRSLFDAAPDQATTLAVLTGRAGLFAPAERRWWSDSYGNGLLTSLAAQRWEREPLPAPRTMPRRNLVVAEFAAGRTTVHVLITQVDARLDHELQMKVVVDRFLALPTPSVLMGELNARHDEASMARLLRAPGVAAYTVDLPTPVGPRPVDWIVARGLVMTGQTTCATGVSDHPLLAVTLQAPP